MFEYPEKYEEHFTLKNNESIFVRPLKATDRPLIVDLLGSLSGRSRYQRFFMNLRSFPDGLLDRLMYMDYDSNFALAGVVGNYGKESVIAVARYTYSSADSFAELALTVRDDFQNLGLGEHLLGAIIAAGREHGYRRFRGLIDPGNKAILHILTAYDARLTLKDNVYYADIMV